MEPTTTADQPIFDIERVQKLRNSLQEKLLENIREFETITGCHVEKVELTNTLQLGYPQKVYSVWCRIVL
jgi:hypothetical protein